jgi:AcrR family transcriptional regulator
MSEPARKRGRPRMMDKEAALAIAARLFWERGYEGTSIADLTKEIGITPPSLYASFGSKDELFKQALDLYVARETTQRHEMLENAASAYEGIEFYLNDAARSATQEGCPRGCAIATAVLQHAEENASVAEGVANRRRAAYDALHVRLERAVNEGDLPEGTDARGLARFYAAVVQGMAAQASDGACRDTLGEIIKVALSAWSGKR